MYTSSNPLCRGRGVNVTMLHTRLLLEEDEGLLRRRAAQGVFIGVCVWGVFLNLFGKMRVLPGSFVHDSTENV